MLTPIYDRASEPGAALPAAELEALVDAASLAICTLDAHALVRSWNRGAERMFGVSAADAIGRFLHNISDAMRPDFDARWARMLAGERCDDVEVRRQRADGRLIDVAFSSALLTGGGAGAARVLVIYTDVTARRRGERLAAAERDVLGRIAGGDALPAVLARIVAIGADEAPTLDMRLLGQDGTPLVGTALLPDDRGERWATPIASAERGMLGTLVCLHPREPAPGASERELVDICVRLSALALDRAAAAAALRAGEERYRLAAEAVTGFIYDWDIQSGHVERSVRIIDLVGDIPEALRGPTSWWNEQIHPEDGPRVLAATGVAFASGPGWTLSYRVRHRDGRWVHVLDQGRVVRDAEGRPVRIVGSCSDITPLKQTEAALRASEERWQVANLGSSDGIWDWDIRSNEVYLSPRWKEMLGYRDDEIPNRFGEWMTRVHPDDRPWVSRAYDDHLAGRTPFYSTEHRMRCKDGSYKWILDRGVALRDGDGRATRMAGSHTDITERKYVEEALGQSRAQYEALMDSVDGIVWEADLRTLCFTFVSRQAERLLGYALERWTDEPDFWASHIHPDDRTEAIAFCTAEVALGRDHKFEYRFQAADGRYLWLRDLVTVVSDDGEPRALRGLMIDVTASRRAEAALRTSEARLDALFGGAPAGLAILDPELRYVQINRTLAALNGQPVEAHIGRTLSEMAPEWAERSEPLLRHVLATGEPAPTDEVELIRNGEHLGFVFVAYFPIRGAAGVSAGVGMMTLDITGQKSLEAQLRQALKMEAVGQLAGGIAHDFNNILTGILSYSELLLSGLVADDPMRADLEQIRDAGIRAAELTRQLLAFSRRQVLQPKPLSLNTVARGLDQMLRRIIGEQLELRAELAPELDSVLADPGQLEQVLLNLVVNARDAMPDGGCITITTANLALDAEGAARLVHIPAGMYVTLTVRDSGVGMDAMTQARMFEPFFTTKEQGKGTGLGLSTVYGIVKQSEGFVFVTSAPGAGSAFTVYLPRAEAAVRADQPRTAARMLRGGSETILLAEDDALVRQLAREVLTRSGYAVLEAADGVEALAVCARPEQRIDLLITDVIMPRLNGRQLVAQLPPERDGLRVLFVSGYSEEAIEHHGVLTPGTELLAKPFTPELLTAKVREILDRPQLA